MYIHIGEDLNIRAQDVVAILDNKSVNSSFFVEEFLKHHPERVINLSKKSFKSVVITKDSVYLSPLASGTLRKRSNPPVMQGFL